MGQTLLLNAIERQQLLMWQLIDAQRALKVLFNHTRFQSDSQKHPLVDRIESQLVDYETRLWQCLPCQMLLQTQFNELQQITDVDGDDEYLGIKTEPLIELHVDGDEIDDEYMASQQQPDNEYMGNKQ